MKGWPANPELVRHLKSNLIRTCVHMDEAVMGLSVHTDGDGEGERDRTRAHGESQLGAGEFWQRAFLVEELAVLGLPRPWVATASNLVCGKGRHRPTAAG